MLKINYDKNMLQEANHFFVENNFCQLSDFLTKESLKLLKSTVKKAKLIIDYEPDERKRKIATIDSDSTNRIKILIESIVQKEINNFSVNLQIYSKGDYTLLKDIQKNKTEKIDFCIDISENWNDKFGGEDHLFIKEELIFSVIPNSFWIAKKIDKNYIKYINCFSKNEKRIIIKGSFV